MPSATRVGPAPRVKNAGSETLAARCGLGTRKTASAIAVAIVAIVAIVACFPTSSLLPPTYNRIMD